MSVEDLIKELQYAVESGKISKDSSVFVMYCSTNEAVIRIEKVERVLVSTNSHRFDMQHVFLTTEFN